MQTDWSNNHASPKDMLRAGLMMSTTFACFAFVASALHGEQSTPVWPQAPELAEITDWINSKPLELKGLRGKVVVLHFWTLGCINCQHNLPYYNRWRADFPGDKLAIVGVHTPETSTEYNTDNVAARVKKLEIKYPVAIDNKLATWKAYKNRYWPSVYVIDKQGRVRLRWDGELEYRDKGGDKLVRAKIQEFLAEAPGP